MNAGRSGSRRVRFIFAALLLLIGLLLVILNGRWLLAEAYTAFATERLHYARHDPATLMAAELSVRLLRSDADQHALYGRLLSSTLKKDVALAEYREALRSAPADPTLWQGFVHLKLALGQFDPEIEHAMRRVRALAPRVLALHADNARLAMQYWHWATPAMRQLWADSVLYTLDFGPKPFLKSVLLSRKEDVLCHERELRHSLTQWWCKGALQAREACFAPVPRKAVLGWCRRIGFVQDPLK